MKVWQRQLVDEQELLKVTIEEFAGAVADVMLFSIKNKLFLINSFPTDTSRSHTTIARYFDIIPSSHPFKVRFKKCGANKWIYNNDTQDRLFKDISQMDYFFKSLEVMLVMGA